MHGAGHMSTLFGSFRSGHGFVATCFFCTLLATLFLPIRAGGQENSTGKSADSNPLSPSWRPLEHQLAGSASRWTVSAEAIVLGHMSGVNRTLVERVRGTVQFYNTATAPGIAALNSNRFQGFSAGPKISLTYNGDSGLGAELTYFNVVNQGAAKAVGPDSPADWLVMKAPGGFWQTQDFPYQAMVWKPTTNLYSAEVNGRFDISRRVTIMAGLRWLQLNDKLQGTLAPADLTAPTWKQTCAFVFPFNCDIFHITPGGPAGHYAPFWNAVSTNNFFGTQIGVAAKLLEFGRFSIDGLTNAGIFDNDAGQSTGVSVRKLVYPSRAATDHASFVSEGRLQLKYRISDGLTVKAGYTALWFAGVALAPGQIQETYSTMNPARVTALGVNCRSSVLFQGATLGLEYSF